MINTILLALVPVFFVMALGFVAGKLRIVDNQHVDSFNALVMDFALPASLFVATASASRSQLLAQAPLFGVSSVVMLLVYAEWLYRSAVWKVPRADASVEALTIAFPNLAGVGLPLSSAMLGPGGNVPVAVALAAGSILVTPLALLVVEMSRSVGGERTGRLWVALGRALTRPVVVAPAAGILLSLLDLRLGVITTACLALIGQAAAGVALFLTGLVLSAHAFRLDWKVVRATAMADLVRPALTAGVVLLLPLSPEAARTAILLGAVPSGFFGILFAVNYGLDSTSTGSMVMASTVCSIVTLAVAIAVLFPH
jgi:malonate transporter